MRHLLRLRPTSCAPMRARLQRRLTHADQCYDQGPVFRQLRLGQHAGQMAVALQHRLLAGDRQPRGDMYLSSIGKALAPAP
nr:hypothetical protein [uncultured Duganella sp.]